MEKTNGWENLGSHVLAELKRINTAYEKLDEKLDKAMIEIAGLKIKSGIWGLIAGAIPVIIGLILYLFKS